MDGFPSFFDGFPWKHCHFFDEKTCFFSYLPFVVKAGFQVAKVRNVAHKGTVYFFRGATWAFFVVISADGFY